MNSTTLLVGLAAAAAACRSTPDANASDESARFEAVFVCRLDARSSGWFGRAAAVVGDLDGDGFREVIVGDPSETWSNTGKFHARSTRSGATLYTWSCFGLSDHSGCSFGSALCSLSDLDGDGFNDFAVGDPSWHPLDGGVRPYGAWIVSSARGAALHEFLELSIPGYGAYLAAPGDLDGDGVDDLLVASIGATPNVVDAQSGLTGARIYRIEFNADPHELVVVADRNGDGVRDFVTWSDGPTVHSGVDGARLASLPPPADDQFGVTFTPREFGDVDGDGIIDFYGRRYVDGLIVSEVVSGADDHVLAELPAAASLAPLGDLDGDGQLEFAPLYYDSEALEVYTLRRVDVRATVAAP